MDRKSLVVSISVVLMVLGASVFTVQVSAGDSNLWHLVKTAYRHLQDQIDNSADMSDYVVDLSVTIQPGGTTTMWARCDSGDKVTGGGLFGLAERAVSSSRPRRLSSGQEEWEIVVHNDKVEDASIHAYAICLDLPPLRP